MPATPAAATDGSLGTDTGRWLASALEPIAAVGLGADVGAGADAAVVANGADAEETPDGAEATAEGAEVNAAAGDTDVGAAAVGVAEALGRPGFTDDPDHTRRTADEVERWSARSPRGRRDPA